MSQFTVLNEKWYNETRNGLDFSLNPLEFTSKFQSNVGEKVKYVFQFDFNEITSFDEALNPLFRLTVGDAFSQKTIQMQAVSSFKNWEDYGYRVGDSIEIWNGGVMILDDVVSNISGYTLTMTNVIVGITSVTVGSVRGKTPIRTFEYNWDLLSNVNGGTQPYLSTFFNSNLRYFNFNSNQVGAGLVRSTAFVNFSTDNFNNWENGTMRMKYVSNPDLYTQRFEVEHTFIVQRINDGDLSRPEPEEIPFKRGTLNYSFDMAQRGGYENGAPNREIGVLNNNGDVGYYNESFDGGVNNYGIVSVEYYNVTQNVVEQKINTNDVTRVTTVINGVGFVAAQPVTAYHTKIPLTTDIENNTLKYSDVFVNDVLRNEIGAVSNSSTIIKNLSITLISPTQIEVQYDLDYTGSEIITNGDSYLLYFGLEDDSLTPNLSNRVSLFADYNNYTKSNDVGTMFEVTNFEIYDHTQTLDIDTPNTDYIGYVEDGILLDITFKHKTSLIDATNITGVSGRIELICNDIIENKYFILNSINLVANGNNVDINGYNYIDSWTILNRGKYLLNENDQFLKAEVEYLGSDGTSAIYRMLLGIKVNWQESINLLQSNFRNQYSDNYNNYNRDFTNFFYTDFINRFRNVAKLNNGINKKTSNYNRTPRYITRLAFNFTTKNYGFNEDNTQFVNFSPIIPIYDYDTNSTYSLFSAETFSESNFNLNQNLLRGEKNKIVFIFDDGNVKSDVNLFDGIIRIEVKNQTGYDIFEISTKLEYSEFSFFTNATKEIIGGKYAISCYVDGVRLTENTYKITGRIFDLDFPYNPSLDATLEAWYDASGLVVNTDNTFGTVNGAGVISKWKNLKGDVSYDLIQPIVGRRPLFNDVDFRIENLTPTDFLYFVNKNLGTQFTIFAVTDAQAISPQNVIDYNVYDNTINQNEIIIVENAVNTTTISSLQAGASVVVFSPTRPIGKAVIQSSFLFGGDWYLKVNNTRYDVPNNIQNTPTIALNTLFSVGNGISGDFLTEIITPSGTSDFRFHEILIYPSQDISLKENEIYLYLQNKWSV